MKQPKRTTRKVSDKTKRKMSLAKQGNKNPRYHVKVNEATKRKISESMKKYWKGIPK